MAHSSIDAELIEAHALQLLRGSSYTQDQTSPPNRLFNGDHTTQLTHDAFAEYYGQQWHLIAGHGDGQYVATQTPKDMDRVIELIRQGDTREAILSELRSTTNAPEEACLNSINLAARLITMMKFGVVKHQAVPRRYIHWDSGPLRDFVKDYLNVAPALGYELVRLPKAFNAWSVEMIGGIQVGFTDNLADHLLLVEDDSKVLIFHHASFLEYQILQDHQSSSNSSPIFPPGFVNETLRTLALLFPQSEFATHRRRKNPKSSWLQTLKERHSHCKVDPRLTRCGNLQVEDRQIERFVFWRDRLVILKQAYDDATPKTISQWWYDRRNSVQWYTFWVAVLVFVVTTFLGVVQCVEGAMQVYVSYKTAS